MHWIFTVPIFSSSSADDCLANFSIDFNHWPKQNRIRAEEKFSYMFVCFVLCLIFCWNDSCLETVCHRKSIMRMSNQIRMQQTNTLIAHKRKTSNLVSTCFAMWERARSVKAVLFVRWVHKTEFRQTKWSATSMKFRLDLISPFDNPCRYGLVCDFSLAAKRGLRKYKWMAMWICAILIGFWLSVCVWERERDLCDVEFHFWSSFSLQLANNFRPAEWKNEE